MVFQYMQYAIVHGFDVYFIKCRKSLYHKCGKIKSVGSFTYTIRYILYKM